MICVTQFFTNLWVRRHVASSSFFVFTFTFHTDLWVKFMWLSSFELFTWFRFSKELLGYKDDDFSCNPLFEKKSSYSEKFTRIFVTFLSNAHSSLWRDFFSRFIQATFWGKKWKLLESWKKLIQRSRLSTVICLQNVFCWTRQMNSSEIVNVDSWKIVWKVEITKFCFVQFRRNDTSNGQNFVIL